MQTSLKLWLAAMSVVRGRGKMTSCFVARISNPGERFGKPFYEVDVPSPLSCRTRPDWLCGTHVSVSSAHFTAKLTGQKEDGHDAEVRSISIPLRCPTRMGKAQIGQNDIVATSRTIYDRMVVAASGQRTSVDFIRPLISVGLSIDMPTNRLQNIMV